jgi:hypothetical protein
MARSDCYSYKLFKIFMVIAASPGSELQAASRPMFDWFLADTSLPNNVKMLCFLLASCQDAVPWLDCSDQLTNVSGNWPEFEQAQQVPTSYYAALRPLKTACHTTFATQTPRGCAEALPASCKLVQSNT